jgi:hypothetical protein
LSTQLAITGHLPNDLPFDSKDRSVAGTSENWEVGSGVGVGVRSIVGSGVGVCEGFWEGDRVAVTERVWLGKPSRGTVFGGMAVRVGEGAAAVLARTGEEIVGLGLGEQVGEEVG